MDENGFWREPPGKEELFFQFKTFTYAVFHRDVSSSWFDSVSSPYGSDTPIVDSNAAEFFLKNSTAFVTLFDHEHRTCVQFGHLHAHLFLIS